MGCALGVLLDHGFAHFIPLVRGDFRAVGHAPRERLAEQGGQSRIGRAWLLCSRRLHAPRPQRLNLQPRRVVALLQRGVLGVLAAQFGAALICNAPSSANELQLVGQSQCFGLCAVCHVGSLIL